MFFVQLSASFHDTLKTVLNSSRISIVGLVSALLSIMKVRSLETAHRIFKSTLKQPSTAAAYERMYSRNFTGYAARMIIAEIQKVPGKKYTLSEVNYMYSILKKSG